MANGQRKRLEKRLDKQRADRANKERNRQDSMYVGGEKEQEHIRKLTREIDDIEVDMATFTSDGQAWLDMRDPGQRTNNQQMMGEIMTRRMLFACASQLRGGLSADKVISAAGMYIGMAAAGQQFREMVNDMKAQALGATVDYMADHPDKKFLGLRGTMMNGLKEKRNKYLAAANGGRVPFTPETAAVADIRMCREAYAQMRDGEHDPTEVMDRYNEARATLMQMMRKDGVSTEDFTRAQRIIVGKVVSAHPEYAAEFDELGYGAWARSDAHEVREPVYDENNRAHMETKRVWTGEYETRDADGNPMPVDGNATFTPRQPMNDIDYACSVMNIMDEHDSGYDILKSDELAMARNSMSNVFGKVEGFPADCPSDDPDERRLFDNAVEQMSAARKMAKADWQSTSGAESVDDRIRRVEMMGFYGGVAKQQGMLLYMDSYSDVESSFDAIDGQHAADISSLSMAFAERMAGADVTSEGFRKHCTELSDWYATASACVDAGIDMDMSRPANREALQEYLRDENNAAKYMDIRGTMAQTMGVYTQAVNQMMQVGATREGALEVLTRAEEDAAQCWTNTYTGDDIASAQAGLSQSREWAQRIVGKVDLSDVPMQERQAGPQNRSPRREASQSSRTADRQRRAEMKFGNIGDGGYQDGAQYE